MQKFVPRTWAWCFRTVVQLFLHMFHDIFDVFLLHPVMHTIKHVHWYLSMSSLLPSHFLCLNPTLQGNIINFLPLFGRFIFTCYCVLMGQRRCNVNIFSLMELTKISHYTDLQLTYIQYVSS